jgi:hypothetical protein
MWSSGSRRVSALHVFVGHHIKPTFANHLWTEPVQLFIGLSNRQWHDEIGLRSRLLIDWEPPGKSASRQVGATWPYPGLYIEVPYARQNRTPNNLRLRGTNEHLASPILGDNLVPPKGDGWTPRGPIWV